MSITQSIILKILPFWAESIERESREWKVTCLDCKSEKTIWELGGIRWKAASVGKRIRVHCSHCNEPKWSTVSREPL